MSTVPKKIGMALPHPGEFIRTEIIEPAGLSVTAAAKALGVSRAALSRLLSGGAGLSENMARRVEKVFGVKAETLLRMQSAYDDAQKARVAAHIEEGFQQAERGELINGDQARREIQSMKIAGVKSDPTGTDLIAALQASPDRDIDIGPERLRTVLERLNDPQPAITSGQLRKNLGLDR